MADIFFSKFAASPPHTSIMNVYSGANAGVVGGLIANNEIQAFYSDNGAAFAAAGSETFNIFSGPLHFGTYCDRNGRAGSADLQISDLKLWQYGAEVPIVVENKSPSDSATGVVLESNISFSLNEGSSPIDLSSIVCSVGATTVYTASTFASGWTSSTVTANDNDYDFVLIHDAIFNEASYTISVEGQDDMALAFSDRWSLRR